MTRLLVKFSMDAAGNALESWKMAASMFWNGYGLPSPACEKLREFLNGNVTVTTLDVSWTGLGDDNGCALVRILPYSRVMHLNLCGAYIGNETVQVLATVLNGTSLTHIDLSCNNISGLYELSRALAQNTTVTSLDLQANAIGDDGVVLLAQALGINTSLTRLNLDGNEIGATGARALIALLVTNPTLTELTVMDNNDISGADAATLRRAVGKNRTIRFH